MMGTISTSGEVVAATSAFTNVGSVGEYTLTISAGVILRKLTTDGFPAGSRLTVRNNGAIIGYGGKGGCSDRTDMPSYAGQIIHMDVTDGGDAISASLPLIIDNTAGYIFGGGGGGAGATQFSARSSGMAWIAFSVHVMCMGGGGAGGGVPGDGGVGFPGRSAYQRNVSDANNSLLFPYGSVIATSGTTGVSGVAGRPGDSTPAGHNPGAGGEYGQAGGNSYVYNNIGDNGAAYPGYSYFVVTGGAGGYAVRANGNAITWLGGNTPERVKGAVA